jgi:hypothetical protein
LFHGHRRTIQAYHPGRRKFTKLKERNGKLNYYSSRPKKEDEDAKIRDLNEYRRRVENDKKKRERRDEIDRQRLTGAIMRQQLAEMTVNDQTEETRTSSAMSTVSRGSRSQSRLSVRQKSDSF